MHIGVIPARKGSKRFPGKNRAKLNGKALWRIAAEKSVIALGKTIVNTDDEKILSFFIEPNPWFIAYRRPKRLAGDDTKIDDTLIEMVDVLRLEESDIIHLFQPTNPFVSFQTIEKSLNLDWGNIDSAQSIWKVPNTLHAYSQRQLINNNVEFVFPENREKHYNSQLKPDFYSFSGYLAFKVGSLLNYGNIWGKKSIGIEVDFIESIDIDTAEDLNYAKKLT